MAEKRAEVKHGIPPYNGFSTKEDSLHSCNVGLNLLSPKKYLQKMWDRNSVVLRFKARLVSDIPIDAKRRFVVQFFVEDDTLPVREPP